MGLNSKGYYSLKDLLKQKAVINWIISERATGKSYAIKEHALKRAWKEKAPTMALIRRHDLEAKPSRVEKYFFERDEKSNIILKVTNGEYDHVKCKSGFIYLAKWVNGKEEKSQFPVGEYFAISTSVHEKSTGHKCKDIICEEMITDGIYLDDEPSKFMQLLSTITRSDDNDVNVFMIGNTINRVCPYFKEWGMNHIFQQEIGSIDTYFYTQTDGAKIKICCERISSRNVKSKLFIGKAEKSIQGGEWETRVFPRLFQPLEKFDEVYTITYKASSGLNFTVKLLIDEEGSKFVYIYPAKHIAERILTSEFSQNPMHTPRLLKNKHSDILIHNCFVMGKVMYSDNMTGTDFENSVKAEKLNPFL